MSRTILKEGVVVVVLQTVDGYRGHAEDQIGILKQIKDDEQLVLKTLISE